MTANLRWSKVAVLAGVCALAAAGCKKEKASGGETTPVTQASEPKADTPDYQEYAPLPKVITEVSLPMLVDQNGTVEVPCFKKQKDSNTQSASMEIKAVIEKKGKYLKEVMTRWLLDDVSPSGFSEEDLAGWDIGVEYPVMVEMDATTLRFLKDQECVQESTGWLEDGVRLVTTVIGSRNFTVESKNRLTVDQQDNLMGALKDKGFTMEGSGLDLYKPILDSEGNQKTNAEKELLYLGPGGLSITEKDMPPEEERGVKEFSFKSENPLFFAFREIPNDSWQKLQKKKSCYVFVVWGDVKPRAPECPEFDFVTFSAEKIDDEKVKVEVSMDKENEKLQLPFETTQKIVLDDRVMLWINVKKEEEGATIRFNSLAVGQIFKK